MQLGTGKFLCLIIVTLLTIFLFIFHHVEGYLSHLTIYFHFFRIGLSFLTTSTISFPHFLVFINTLEKNVFNLFFFISLNFFTCWNRRLVYWWSNWGTIGWRGVFMVVLSAICHWKHESDNVFSFLPSSLPCARIYFI